MALIQDETSRQIIEITRKLTREKPADKITVRDILKELSLTNRVFYNRFHNIEEVLDILYQETISKVRESLSLPWDGKEDFGDHILKIASQTLVLTYASRQHMSQFIFGADSISNENFEWWDQEIKQLVSLGLDIHYLRQDLDQDAISYSIWCFIRGFNADALSRELPEEEALKFFHYGFGILLEGMKAKKKN